MTPRGPTVDARAALRRRLGLVIPVCLPSGGERALARVVLEDTVQQACEAIEDPVRVCLAVDGRAAGEREAAALARRYGAALASLEQNQGKFAATAAGMRVLLERPDCDYLAVVDQDGDHTPIECLHFLRAALRLGALRHDPRVIILGRRHSRHAPLGFLRGEFEELADRVLLDALHYHAAVAGKPLALEHALALDEFPDFHSGFKLFDRTTAVAVFGSEPRLAGLPPEAGLMHACEAMMTVEALVAGACLGCVHRTALCRPPVSLFAAYDRIRMVADKILWPCRRLEIPPAFAAQWLDNHLPRLLLGTLAPAGREEIVALRRLLRRDLGFDGEPGPWIEPEFL